MRACSAPFRAYVGAWGCGRIAHTIVSHLAVSQPARNLRPPAQPHDRQLARLQLREVERHEAPEPVAYFERPSRVAAASTSAIAPSNSSQRFGPFVGTQRFAVDRSLDHGDGVAQLADDLGQVGQRCRRRA
jgi:hypothetical protein